MSKVTIELRNGPQHNTHVTQEDVQRNIDALQRAVDGKPRASDFVLLTDTMSILENIKEQLPMRHRP